MASTRPTVHIMHPDDVIATGLHAILMASGEFAVTLHAAAPDALPAARLVVADHETGIALARQPAPGMDRPPILVITPFDREGEVRAALDGGVLGYVLQSADGQEILDAIRTVAQGRRYLSAPILPKVADSFAREALTGRENDVLHLLAEGCCNKTIARRLNIGPGTVKTHVRSVMAKLDVHARSHAVIVATERGLVAARTGRGQPNY